MIEYRWLICLYLASSPMLSAQELSIQHYELTNGLQVYTHEAYSAPLVSFYIFYRVGSMNEGPGITGISHLFEHMMFNGSAKYGPSEFDMLLEAAGGNSNGYTTRDMTVYLETFPPDALDLVLDLEADRMASMTISPENLEQERAIVKEERRLRTDNDHTGKMDESLFLHAFVSHPFRTPVVGFMHDLDHISLEDTRKYFETYYTPNNAIVMLVGDFQSEEVIEKVKNTLGQVPRGPDVDDLFADEPDQEGERRVTLVREAELPMLMVGWHVPGVDNEADTAALDVLAALLSRGESSRLYKTLVYDKELAIQVDTWNDVYRGPSLFVVYLQVAPGKESGEAERVLFEAIDALGEEAPGEMEVRKARNQIRASILRSLKSIDGRANQLGRHALRYGDPAALKRLMELRDKVTGKDIQRIVKKYFMKKNRTIVWVQPLDSERAEADDRAFEGEGR